MLIPLLELILHFNKEINLHNKLTDEDYYSICESTLAYLNLYRQTQEMLNRLGDLCNSMLDKMKEQ